MDEVSDMEQLAEEYRVHAENLIKESERMMEEHRMLVKRVKTLSARARNFAKMRDECAREASDSESKAEYWRAQDNGRNQSNMYSQAAKGMRIKEKKAESDRIKSERMIDEHNERAYHLKKESIELKRMSNEQYELYLGQLRTISKLKKE